MKPSTKSRTPAIKKSKILRSDFIVMTAIVVSTLGCGNRPAEQPRHYPEPDSPQAALYLAKCGQCHGAPMPSAHTANVWPSILDRMQIHIKANNASPVSREEMSIILGYLQQNAQQTASQQSGFQQSSTSLPGTTQSSQPAAGANR
jgi:hypothetical protein